MILLKREDFSRLAWEEYAYDTVEVPVRVYQADVHQADVSDLVRSSASASGVCEVVHALAFKTNPCAIASARTLPSERYIRIIREGARTSGVESSYLRWLEQIPSA